MTIFEAIRDDHQTQRTLADQLVKTEGASEGRKELFDRLRTEMTAHAGAEERYFYVPLMESDETQDSARHSIAEHKELEDALEKLAEMDMSASQWLIDARALADRLTHHLDEEEREVFPVAGRVLSEADKTSLGAAFRADMERRAEAS